MRAGKEYKQLITGEGDVNIQVQMQKKIVIYNKKNVEMKGDTIMFSSFNHVYVT